MWSQGSHNLAWIFPWDYPRETQVSLKEPGIIHQQALPSSHPYSQPTPHLETPVFSFTDCFLQIWMFWYRIQI